MATVVEAGDTAAAIGAGVALPWLYPALTGCIGEQRSPTRKELRLIAARLWREELARRLASPASTPGFAARRILWRAAWTALRGSPAA
jgi:hypothetical protein